MKPLSMEHVTGVCRLGQGARCCAYLLAGGRVDEMPGWACAKGEGRESVKAEIDRRQAAGTMVARGDNCSGPPAYLEVPR